MRIIALVRTNVFGRIIAASPVNRDRGRAAITRYLASVHATRAINGMLRSHGKSEASQTYQACKHVARGSMFGMSAVYLHTYGRAYPDMLSADDEKRIPSLNRRAARIASRLSPAALAKASDADAAIERDIELAIKARQYARIAGVAANGTDYVKGQRTAAGHNSDTRCDVRGELANVRYCAHWREGFDSKKYAKRDARLVANYRKAVMPWLVDTHGVMRTPRVLKDGSIVYGRDKVSGAVLRARYEEAQAIEQATEERLTDDASELAALLAAHKADARAQLKGRIAAADRARWIATHEDDSAE